MFTAPAIAARLDRATAERRLLDHPFYRSWALGRLSLDDLRFYSAQYWHQVASFPGFLDSLGARLGESTAADIVAGNLADERDGDHPGLWLRFAEAVGISADEVRASTPEPETTRCVALFDDAAREAPVAFALGMLYGFESQSPEVANTKVEGLRTHYGIDGDGVAYFELHGQLDVEHAAEVAAAVAEFVTDEADLRVAERGACAGAEAAWGLLDGVVRARAIAC